MTEPTTTEPAEIKPVAPPGYRFRGPADLALPLPHGTRCALYPWKDWLPSCRVGEIVTESLHTYVVPIAVQVGVIDPQQPEVILTSAIAELLPATFYADSPLLERLQFMVEGWQKAVASCICMDEIINMLGQREEYLGFASLPKMVEQVLADLDYFRKAEKQGKRPFSHALSGKVIEGQLKRIQELEQRCAELLAHRREEDNMAGAVLGSTIVAQRDRIAELEKDANQNIAITRLLARRLALDGYATNPEKVEAMLKLCETADPAGALAIATRERDEYLVDLQKGLRDYRVLEGERNGLHVRIQELEQRLAVLDQNTGEELAQLRHEHAEMTKLLPFVDQEGPDAYKRWVDLNNDLSKIKGERNNLEVERQKWEDESKRYAANADYWREQGAKLQTALDQATAERDALQATFDKLPS